MTSAQLQTLAISAGILFAAYKFGPGIAQAGAVSIAAVIIGKQIPYLSTSLA